MVMRQQEPFPMVVMNLAYDVLRTNDAAQTVFSHFVQDSSRLAAALNLYALVFDPQLARPFIQNWAAVGQHMAARLHREALARPNDARLGTLLDQVLAFSNVPPVWRQPDFSRASQPTFSLVLERGPLSLRFFMVVTAFAAPQQITLEELRIESYFPADEATRLACERLATNYSKIDSASSSSAGGWRPILLNGIPCRATTPHPPRNARGSPHHTLESAVRYWPPCAWASSAFSF